MGSHRKSLKQLVADEQASTKQAGLYRAMAEAVRRVDPTYSSAVVNEEAVRLLGLAAELDEDAEETAREIASRYTYAEAAAAYDRVGGF